MKKKNVMKFLALLTAGAMALGGISVSAAAEEGKHINGALYWFGGSLDPHADWDGWTTCRAGITETLVTVNEKYEIVPLLSDSWEQVDDSTWKMHIREGVTFHNGKAVDGEAVKKSFERAMETQDRAVTAAKIESIEADGQDVTFKTTEPFGAFLANISEPMYSVVDVDAGTDFASAPIATGPYMVTGFEVNTSIDLAKYDGYWNGASDVDTITIKNIEDDSTRGMALQSGEMDIVQRVALTDLPAFESNEDYVVYDTQGARTRILAFNYNVEALKDVNVRKAIMESIDYDALVSVLGSGVSKAGAPYPASSPYGYEELENKQAYNAEDAVKCLEAAGYTDSDGNGYVDKDGEELTLTITYDNTSYTTMLEAIQDMGKQTGIHYELNLVDSIADAEENRSFDILATNWQVLSTGDPQWFLDSLYKSGVSSNFGDYSNTELDAVIDELAKTFDIDGRENLTIEAEKILLDDVASIYLVGENNFVVANKNVTNVVPYPIDYYFVDNGLSIEK
ncbi:MAG: ABC transporter substrate-binding protein [Eubacteriales bacterium]|nr:ABC transporter substrate-binding protein [Eubacteriales bacterium]